MKFSLKSLSILLSGMISTCAMPFCTQANVNAGYIDSMPNESVVVMETEYVNNNSEIEIVTNLEWSEIDEADIMADDMEYPVQKGIEDNINITSIEANSKLYNISDAEYSMSGELICHSDNNIILINNGNVIIYEENNDDAIVLDMNDCVINH